MYVVILGPPGAGKGTQTVRLAAATSLAHVATGDMFRDNIRSGTELGRLAEGYITQGELVPDRLTIDLLMDRLEEPDTVSGAIFDGFPRTIPQAQSLDEALQDRNRQVDVALLIDVAEAEIMRRLSGRWTCPNCGAVFQERTDPPKRDGECDNCGKQLAQRPDDAPAAIRNRLQVYREQTAPLVAYYEKAGLLIPIDGERPPDAVQTALLGALEPILA